VPLGDPSIFEESVDDLRVVLDAAGPEQAFLLADTNAVSLACVFAATFPERTAGLVLSGGAAALIDHGDGVGIAPDARGAVVDLLVRSFGDPDGIARLTMRGEGREEDRRHAARYERMAASPALIRPLIEMILEC